MRSSRPEFSEKDFRSLEVKYKTAGRKRACGYLDRENKVNEPIQTEAHLVFGLKQLSFSCKRTSFQQNFAECITANNGLQAVFWYNFRP